MKFDFYYGSQADQFSFIKIPRAMITDEVFASLSLQAKMLYSILLDRMTLSRKNGWFDEQNRVFIIYPITEIQSDLGFSKKKAMDYLAELEKFGLIFKKKRGFGLPSIIYVKSFLVPQECSRGIKTGTSAFPRSTEYGTSGDLKYTARGNETGTSEVPESIPPEVTGSLLPEVPKQAVLISKTEMNKTDLRHTESNHILSISESDENGSDESRIDTCREIIKENIEFHSLKELYPDDRELLEGIVDLMLEVVFNQNQTMVIASGTYPTEVVRSRFLKLNFSHIDYVMECFKQNTTKIGNIKKYLMTVLFNAPSTISGYYTAAVQHDMPYLAAK